MTVENLVEVVQETVTAPVKPVVAQPVEETVAAEVTEKEPTAEELKALEALPELRSAADAAFAKEQWTEAVEKLSAASELLASAYGPLSPKCGEILFLYGRALYFFALEQKKMNTEETEETEAVAAGETTESAEAETEAAETTEVVETEAEAEVEMEEDGAGAEEKSDFQTAFEILDTARVVLAKMDTEESKKMIAETYMTLGDLALEDENFAQAVADFTAGLELASTVFADTDRTVASVRYKLANALEVEGMNERAVEEVQKGIELLKLRMEKLTSGDLKVSHDKEVEIKEIQELVSEMETKINDLKLAPAESPANDDELVDKAADMMKSRKSDAAEFFAQRLASSGLKRKAEEAPVAESEEAKKVKETEE